ncbi:hypothetical protein BESB_046190 [Besnoitia besnoiti]|uniref:Uncharacterized protein n=1 Tax=Besnoitia besnoiti TaxID=94643 RepID=A0A2A9MLB8_BESBE|nr:hypothetical protein BESB_046190 [Besnoitia besnoiti]PFH36427.1 hypothetical protein BESB_046190 [Besnoitia besnoiti]
MERPEARRSKESRPGTPPLSDGPPPSSACHSRPSSSAGGVKASCAGESPTAGAWDGAVSEFSAISTSPAASAGPNWEPAATSGATSPTLPSVSSVSSATSPNGGDASPQPEASGGEAESPPGTAGSNARRRSSSSPSLRPSPEAHHPGGRKRARSPVSAALSSVSSSAASGGGGGSHHPVQQRELVLMQRMTQDQFQQRLADLGWYRQTLQVINFRNAVFPSTYSVALFLSAAAAAPQLIKVLMYYFDSLPPAQYRVFCYGLARCQHIRHLDANATGTAGLPAWRTRLLLRKLEAFPDIRHVTLSGNELESFRGARRRRKLGARTGGDATPPRPSSDSDDLDDEERQEEAEEWGRDADYIFDVEAEDADAKKRREKRDSAAARASDAALVPGAPAQNGVTEKKPSNHPPGGAPAAPAEHTAPGQESEAEKVDAARSADVEEDLETTAKQLLAQVLADVRSGRRAARRRRYFPGAGQKEHCPSPVRSDEKEKRSLSPAPSCVFENEARETRAVHNLRELMVRGVVCLQIKECALAQQSQLSLWVLNSCHLLRLRQLDMGKADRSLALVMPEERDPSTNDELLRRICLMSRPLWTRRKQSSDILTAFHAIDDWREPMLPYFWLYALLDCMLLYAHNHPPASLPSPSHAASTKPGEIPPSSGGVMPHSPFPGAAYASLLKHRRLMRQPLVRVWFPPQDPQQAVGLALRLPPGCAGFCYALLMGRVGDRCLVRWLARRQFSEHLEQDIRACKQSFAVSSSEGATPDSSSVHPQRLSCPSSASPVSSYVAEILARFKKLNPFPPLCPLCLPTAAAPADGSTALGAAAFGAHSQASRSRASSRLAAVAAAAAVAAHGAAASSPFYTTGLDCPQMRQKRELELFFGKFDAVVHVSRVEPAAFAWDWRLSREQEEGEGGVHREREADGEFDPSSACTEGAEKPETEDCGASVGEGETEKGRLLHGPKSSLPAHVKREPSAGRDGERRTDDKRGISSMGGEEGIGVGSWVEVDLGGEEDAGKQFVTAIGIICQVDQAPAGAPPATLPSWQDPGCAFNPRFGLAVQESRSPSAPRPGALAAAQRNLLFSARFRVNLLHTKPTAPSSASSHGVKSSSARGNAPSTGGKNVAPPGGSAKGSDAGRVVSVPFSRVRPLQVLLPPKETWSLAAVRSQAAKIKEDAERRGVEKRYWGFGGPLGSCVLLPKEWGIDAAESDFGAPRAFPSALSRPLASAPPAPPAASAPSVFHSRVLQFFEPEQVEFMQKNMHHPRQLIAHFGFSSPSPPVSGSPSVMGRRRSYGGNASLRGGSCTGSSAISVASSVSRASSEASREASPRLEPSGADRGLGFDASDGAAEGEERGAAGPSGAPAGAAAAPASRDGGGFLPQAAEEKKVLSVPVGGRGHLGSPGCAGWSAPLKHGGQGAPPGFNRLAYAHVLLPPPAPPRGFFSLLSGSGGGSQSQSSSAKGVKQEGGNSKGGAVEKSSGEGAGDLKPPHGRSAPSVDSSLSPRGGSRCPSPGDAGSAGRCSSSTSRRSSTPQHVDFFGPESGARHDSPFPVSDGSVVGASPREWGSARAHSPPAGTSSTSHKKRAPGSAQESGAAAAARVGAARGAGAVSKDAKGGGAAFAKGAAASAHANGAPHSKRARVTYSPTISGKTRSVGSDKSVSPPPFRLDRERSPSPVRGGPGSGRLRQQRAYQCTDGQGSNLVVCVEIFDDDDDEEARTKGSAAAGRGEKKAKKDEDDASHLTLGEGGRCGADTAASRYVATRTLARGPLAAGRYAEGDGEFHAWRNGTLRRRRRTEAERAERRRRQEMEEQSYQKTRESEWLWGLSLPCPALSPSDEGAAAEAPACDVSLCEGGDGRRESPTDEQDRSCLSPHPRLPLAPSTVRSLHAESWSLSESSKSPSSVSSRPSSPSSSPSLTACCAAGPAPFTLHLSRGIDGLRGDCAAEAPPNPLLPPARQPLEASEWQLIKTALHILRGRGVCGLICEPGGSLLSAGSAKEAATERQRYICLPLSADLWQTGGYQGENPFVSSLAGAEAGSREPGGSDLLWGTATHLRKGREGSCLAGGDAAQPGKRHVLHDDCSGDRRPRKRFWRLNEEALDQLRCFLEFRVSRRRSRMLQDEHFLTCPAALERRASPFPPTRGRERSPVSVQDTVLGAAFGRPDSTDLLGPLLACVPPRPPAPPRRERSKADRFAGRRAPPPESAPARAAVLRSCRMAAEALAAGGVEGPPPAGAGGGDAAAAGRWECGSAGAGVPREGSSGRTEGGFSAGHVGAGKKRSRGKASAGAAHSHVWSWNWEAVGGDYGLDNRGIYRRYAEAILDQQARRRKRRLESDGQVGCFGWRRDYVMRLLKKASSRSPQGDDCEDERMGDDDGSRGLAHRRDGIENLGESIEDRFYRALNRFVDPGALWGLGAAHAGSAPDASSSRGGAESIAGNFSSGNGVKRPVSSTGRRSVFSGDECSEIDTEEDEEDPTVQRRLRRERRAAANEAAAAAAAEEGPSLAGPCGHSATRRSSSPATSQESSRFPAASSSSTTAVKKPLPASRKPGRPRKASAGPASTAGSSAVSSPPAAAAPGVPDPRTVPSRDSHGRFLPGGSPASASPVCQQTAVADQKRMPQRPPPGARGAQVAKLPIGQSDAPCGVQAANRESDVKAATGPEEHAENVNRSVPDSSAGRASGEHALRGGTQILSQRASLKADSGDGREPSHAGGVAAAAAPEGRTLSAADHALSRDFEANPATRGRGEGGEGAEDSWEGVAAKQPDPQEEETPPPSEAAKVVVSGQPKSQSDEADAPELDAAKRVQDTTDEQEQDGVSSVSLSPVISVESPVEGLSTCGVRPAAASGSAGAPHVSQRSGLDGTGRGNESGETHSASSPSGAGLHYESRFHDASCATGGGAGQADRAGGPDEVPSPAAQPPQRLGEWGPAAAAAGAGTVQVVSLGSLPPQFSAVPHGHQFARYPEQFQHHLAHQQLSHRQWVQQHQAAAAYYAVHGFQHHGQIFAAPAVYAAGSGGGRPGCGSVQALHGVAGSVSSASSASSCADAGLPAGQLVALSVPDVCASAHPSPPRAIELGFFPQANGHVLTSRPGSAPSDSFDAAAARGGPPEGCRLDVGHFRDGDTCAVTECAGGSAALSRGGRLKAEGDSLAQHCAGTMAVALGGGRAPRSSAAEQVIDLTEDD